MRLKVEKIKKIINDNFDLSPRGIREMLNLNKPFTKSLLRTDTLGENPLIKVNFPGKRQINKFI